MQSIQKIGIDINKEELIAALNYDRKQYEKGYWDGVEAARENFNELLQKLQAVINESKEK